MVKTDDAPIAMMMPANKNMLAWAPPNNGNSAKLASEATICGKQIEPLNKPK
jgi:hypothetical protein